MSQLANVTSLEAARAARAERAEAVVRVDPDEGAYARCALTGCGKPLYIEWHTSRLIFCADTADDLAAPPAPHAMSWQVSCEAGHVVLLPVANDEDDYSFGQCTCDGQPELLADCGHNDMARLRRVVA